MRFRLCRMFILLVFVLPLAAGFCSEEDTKEYLTAGTQYEFTPKQVDYTIVIDGSGSMEGVKIQTLQNAASRLIDQMQPTDRAAVISFNYEARLHNEFTNDHDQLHEAINGIQAGFSTQYLPPLLLAQEELLGSRNQKALIFLSDGKSDFAEEPEQILELTRELASQGVCILTISYALGGEESPLLTAMAGVGAEYGCGEHFIASEQGNELEVVFSRIYEALSASEAIRVLPLFSQSGYSFSFASSINGRPVPGESGGACIDQPDFYLSIYNDGRLIRTAESSSGSLTLPPGNYTYKATASVRCEGDCNFIGSAAGELTIGGACNPGYQELATYVTGETQKVLITGSGFSPRSIAGRQGTLVVWENVDSEPRRLTSAFFDETIAPGDSFTYVIQNVGTLVYSDPDRNITASVAPIQGTGNDILLIIDESGSMKGAGIAEARIAATKFFSLLSAADRGALITFSENAYLVQDFTSDRSQLNAGADAIRAEGATSYLAALRLAATLRPTQQSILIFMSDGVPTDATDAAILDATAELRDAEWCIMTVGFGEESERARTLLTRMAGDDDCGAFLYASSGNLSSIFGTIYQLAKSQHDLSFENTQFPSLRFSARAPIATSVLGKTGREVPGLENDLCAPEAIVQARTEAGVVQLLYTDSMYRGDLVLEPGFNRVSLIASVSAVDEPGRPFVGTAKYSVLYLPLPVLGLTGLLAGIVIYLVFFRRTHDAT